MLRHNQNYITRGGHSSMPSFYKYDNGLSISIGAVGCRRCKLVSMFLPYLYGSDIKFDIHIKRE